MEQSRYRCAAARTRQQVHTHTVPNAPNLNPSNILTQECARAKRKNRKLSDPHQLYIYIHILLVLLKINKINRHRIGSRRKRNKRTINKPQEQWENGRQGERETNLLYLIRLINPIRKTVSLWRSTIFGYILDICWAMCLSASMLSACLWSRTFVVIVN